MTAKNVKNVSNPPQPLGFPRGPVIQHGQTGRVEDWNVVESNSVVQAWLRAKAIEVSDAPDRPEDQQETNTTAGANQGGSTNTKQPGDGNDSVTGGDNDNDEDGDGVPDDAPADEFTDMSKGELAGYIEKRGATDQMKSGMKKADLLKIARALPKA